jgi:hypothetical protein
LFEEAGFVLLEDRHDAPDPEHVGGVDRQFAGYTPEELAISRSHLVHRSPA